MCSKSFQRILVVSVTLGFTIVGISAAVPRNSDNNAEAPPPPPSNLRYTFGSDEEIPAGFFDNPEPESRVQTRQDSGQQFAACKDGSGGFCIPLGQCSADKKPDVTNARACEAGEECCFGLPPSNTPCKNKGGECVKAPRSCGNGPQIRSGTECDHQNGETCCIWIF